jgi:hypothetical protein
MAKKVEIELDVKGNIVESTKNLKALKMQLKDVAAGTAEWSKIKNDIRDIEDAIESAGQSSEDFKGLLENAPGPLGVLGGAIKKVELATKSWGSALKATGIGLLVSLIGGLVAAFSQTEGSMKKLEPLLIGMEKIFGGIVEMAQPLLNMILELGMKALPYVTGAFKNVYSAVFAVFQSLGKLGQAVGKLIKGDFAGAWETAKESVTKFGENFTQNQQNFEKGAAKMTKTQKENAAKQKEIGDKALQDQLKRLDANNKISDAELEKAKAIAMGLATTEQEKLQVEMDFAKKSYDLKKKELEEKQALYKKGSVEYKDYQAQLIKLESDTITQSNGFKDKQAELDKKRKEDEKKAVDDFNKEVADIKVNAIKDETKKLEAAENKRFDEQRSKIVEKMLALGKTTEEMNEVLELIEQTHQNNLTKIKNDAKLKEAEIEKGERDAKYVRMMAGFTNDLDMQRTLLEAKKAADDEYYKTQLEKEGLTSEQIKALNDKKLADQIEYTNKSSEIEKNRIAVKQKALDDIISIAGAESDVGKAALIAKQILMARELAMEIAKTITFSTQAAARSVVAVAEGTAQTAKIGFPQNIPMLIGYAAQAVAIIAAIVSAVKSAKGSASAVPTTASSATTPAPAATPNYGKNYGDGGMIDGPRHAAGGVMINAEGGEAIMSRGSVTMFAPLLSAMNQMGGGTAFSGGAVGRANMDNPKVADATNQNPMIVKTYVVSNDLTTEAEKQAKLKDLSTL